MDFLRIKNRNNFLLGELPQINPHSRRYITFFREQKRRSIDGFWSIDNALIDVDICVENPKFEEDCNSWRYMPPACYFYVNFGTIMANRKGASSGAKFAVRPNLDDVEWEYHYCMMEVRGFSGFEFDDEFSCNRFLEDEELTDDMLKERCLDEQGKIIDILYDNFFKADGSRKTYVPVREYIRRLFSKPLGRPVYGNIPKNMMILATRDGGKSYLTAGIIAHELVFDGQRQYQRELKSKPIAEIVVGAAISDKSRDLLKKAKLFIDNLPGAWKPNSSDEVPSPFFKHMSGSIGANKEWTHKYEKKLAGDWKTIEGSFAKHRVFTTENPEAAAGGRPGTVIVEEVGLMGNVISVHGGNDAAQNDGGEKFGSAIYIGTAGNVEKITESELIFNGPVGFDMLEFENIWEDEVSHPTCWFIPATHMARKFKDRNGNTRVAEAEKHFQARRNKAAKSHSKKLLETELMNYPLVPSEMFINADDNIFPVRDLKHVYSRLISNRRSLDLSYKVEFFIKEDGRIDFKNVKREPIREYPLRTAGKDMDGCPEIFMMPTRDVYGNVPANIHIAGFDPIDDDDNSDVTRSLQSFWIMNRLTGELVFEYTGRTSLASTFYEQCRRALIYFNAICNYENNKKGFYAHMYNNASLHLLAETPEILMQKDMQKSKGIGNKSLGTNVNIDVKSFGLELLLKYLTSKAEGQDNPNILNLHLIKSPALLRELISFKPDGNYDRISALIVLLIFREEKRRIRKVSVERVKSALDDDFFKDTWDSAQRDNNQSVY